MARFQRVGDAADKEDEVLADQGWLHGKISTDGESVDQDWLEERFQHCVRRLQKSVHLNTSDKQDGGPAAQGQLVERFQRAVKV